MSRDQGPQMHTREGGASINTDIPKPTDGGDLVFFDKTGELIFWAGAAVMVIALFSIIASLTIFFFN